MGKAPADWMDYAERWKKSIKTLPRSRIKALEEKMKMEFNGFGWLYKEELFVMAL